MTCPSYLLPTTFGWENLPSNVGWGEANLTPWIFAQKWGRQNMSLEKIYFALWMYSKAGEKEFLKSYIGLSSCHLTSTGQPAHSAGLIGAAYRICLNAAPGFYFPFWVFGWGSIQISPTWGSNQDGVLLIHSGHKIKHRITNMFFFSIVNIKITSPRDVTWPRAPKSLLEVNDRVNWQLNWMTV